MPASEHNWDDVPTLYTYRSVMQNLSTAATILNSEYLGSLASGWSVGQLEFYYRKISCGKTMATNQKNFCEFSRVSPGDQPLAKEPEDSAYEIATANNSDSQRIAKS